MKPFRDAILDLLLVTRGIEKNILFRLYVDKGLWSLDLDMLRNVYWHKRLAALVRLEQWQFCIGLENLAHLTEDENIQIRQIALKNLARTKFHEEADFLLKKLAHQKLHYSILYESIKRLIFNHQELVLNCLNDQQFKNLYPAILKVLGDTRVLEGVPALIKTAENSVESDLREKALISLGKIGDERGLVVLRKKIQSEFARERLASLRSLFSIDIGELKPFENDLVKDPDENVRSWFAHYKRGGV